MVKTIMTCAKPQFRVKTHCRTRRKNPPRAMQYRAVPKDGGDVGRSSRAKPRLKYKGITKDKIAQSRLKK